MSTYYLDLYMKKYLTLTICIAGFLFLAIYFYFVSESKNYPNENFLKKWLKKVFLTFCKDKGINCF